jgi:hypothetical protein
MSFENSLKNLLAAFALVPNTALGNIDDLSPGYLKLH